MPETCVVQLTNSNPPEAHCQQLDNHNALQGEARTLPLTELKATLGDSSIVVLIPADEVIILQAQLPANLKSNRLLQALPFALEEQLSEKPAHYHFVPLGKQNDKGDIAVAVIDKQRLGYWQQCLQEHGLEADCMLPTLLAVPYIENTISIMIDDKHCLVRSGRYRGFFTHRDTLQTLLALHCQEIGGVDRMIVYQYGQQAESFDDPAFATMQIEKANNLHNTSLPDLSIAAMQSLDCNLLTGEFYSHSKHAKAKRYWLLAVIFLALLVMIAVINVIVQYSVYSHDNAKLNKEITRLYKQNFPNSTDIVAPRERLQSKLHALNAVAEGNPFLSLLGKSGNVFRTADNVTINNIIFSNRTLRLTVSSPDFSHVSKVVQQLNVQQLQVSQSNARTRGKQVTTDIIIKERQR